MWPIDNHLIAIVNELRYFGVFFKSGYILKLNLDYGKKKLFRCLNSILARTGYKPEIVLSLCNSFCVPLLPYGTIDLNKTEKKLIASVYNRLFLKLFHTYRYDSSIVRNCQSYMSYLPLDYIVDLKKLKFLTKCLYSTNSIIVAVRQFSLVRRI